MSTAQWKEQLEQILNSPLRVLRIDLQEWNNASLEQGVLTPLEAVPGVSLNVAGGRIWYAVRMDRAHVEVIELEADALSETERRLVGWTIENMKPVKPSVPHAAQEAERQAVELGVWITDQLDQGRLDNEVPEAMTFGGRLFSDMIPFLLVSEHERLRNTYAELEKLLNSFFIEEVMLIPLKDQEWLILGPMSLLSDAENEDRSEGDEETPRELLASMCSGLHGMLASEWVGECHLAVGEPIGPAKAIVETTSSLRETVFLGRKFHVGENVHLPWMLHLERLLGSIPESRRAEYMEQLLNRSDVLLEPEILMTLETFFRLDCNVSETAKKLYIHRNTLLYRLDKLKQETGLDVRMFRDAVLVKIILLLYKVTKRK